MKPFTTADASASSMSAPELRIAAGFCLFLSVVGAAINGYLTVLKFRMRYTPCLTDEGSCKIGDMSCSDALSSSWSMMLNLPISVWGTALYVIMALLAAGIVWRKNFLGGVAPDVLLACAIWAVLCTLVLGSYTLLALEAACPFCMTLYAVSVLLLAGAQLARGPSGLRRPRAWLAELRRRVSALGEAVFYAALAFICVAGVQSMTYHGMRNYADSQDGCPEPKLKLPTSSIRAGSDDPKAIVVIFIDMTCHRCQREFRKLGGALNAGEFPEPVQLWIIHTPRQTCDPSAFPAGKAKSDERARNDNACLAARAVECVEKLQPGAGFDYIARLFALHEGRLPDVALFTADRVAEVAAEAELEIDPDDADNALFKCINTDTGVLERITEHQRYAEDFKVPTIAVYRVKNGAPDLDSKPLYADGNTALAGLFSFVSVQAKAQQ